MNTTPPAQPANAVLRRFVADVEWRPNTLRVGLNTLNRFNAFLTGRGKSLQTADRADVEAWKVAISDEPGRGRDRKSPTTVRNQLRHVRGFYRWATSEDVALCDIDPAKAVKLPKRGQETRRPTVQDDVVDRMIRAIDRRSENGRRDVAILRVLRATGIRRGELAALNLADFRADFHGLGPMLLIGNPDAETKTLLNRDVPLSQDAARALDFYLIERGEDPGPLFLSRTGRRLTVGGVSQVIDRARVRAGIGHPIGLHAFRRASAIHCRRMGMSDAAIIKLHGWGNIDRLIEYTSESDTELAVAEFRNLVDPPKATKGKGSRGPRPRPRRAA